jgi:Tfp pilus assembly protein PilF/TolB-like protein
LFNSGLSFVIRLAITITVLLTGVAELHSQTLQTQTLLVMPFENHSKAPGLDWIAEGFPQVLSQRMASSNLYVISREDRVYAFDRAGVPAGTHPSRAMIYSVAEQMDPGYLVLGDYDFNGETFTARAQVLDMKKLHLMSTAQSSGKLTSLIDIQTDLAWQLLQQIPGHSAVTREQFVKTSQPIRLDAFENYIRGVLAVNRQEKIRYFRQAIRLNPNYTLAMLELGKAYYDGHEYESAAQWLGRIPKDDPVAGQANFLLGMAEFYRGSYDKAYAAFSFLVARLPLTEVYNNLGVVEARRGHRAAAIEDFTKAVKADPSDPDYHFNLAVAFYKNGDSAAAAQQLREEFQRRANDQEARALLENINRGIVPPPSASASQTSGMQAVLGVAGQPRVPLERMKRNYDEASYQRLELEIRSLEEAQMAGKGANAHLKYHMERGQEALARNSLAEAESEFREAVSIDSNNAAAHAGLARVLEQKGDTAGARSEAQLSNRIKPNVDALLVLGRLALKQNQLEAASNSVQSALKLEPANSAAAQLQRDITAKQRAIHQ